MATDLERLVLSIETNTKQLEKGLKRVESRVDGTMKRSARSTKRLNATLTQTATIARTLMTTLGAGFAIGGLASLPMVLRSVVAEADKIGQVADKVGLTTDALQEMRYAGEQVGVQMNQVDMGLQRFSRRIAEAASGSGELLPMLEANNVQLRDQQGRIRPLNDLLEEYAELIRGADTEQERLLLGFKAFDSEGAAMVNMLRDGRAGLKEYGQQARDLGGILSRDLIDRAEEVNSDFSDLTLALGTRFKQGILVGIDAIDQYIDKMGELQTAVSDLWSDPSWRNFSRAMIGDDVTNWMMGRDVDLSKGPPRRLGRRGAPPPDTRIVDPDDEDDKKGGKSEAEKSAERIQKTIDALKFEEEQLGRTSEEQRLYNELKQAGVALNSEAGQKIEALVQKIEKQEAAQKRLEEQQERLNDTMEEMGSIAGDALASIISDSEDAEKAVARLAIQLAKAALQASNLGGDGFFGGFLNSLLGGFGGFFDKGGRLGAGQWGIAGESGPEVVHGPAKITPMGDVRPPMMAGRQRPIEINISSRFEADGGFESAVERTSRPVAQQEASQATGQLARAVPSMVDGRNQERETRRIRPRTSA